MGDNNRLFTNLQKNINKQTIDIKKLRYLNYNRLVQNAYQNYHRKRDFYLIWSKFK